MRKNPLSTKQVFTWVMILSLIGILLPKRLTDSLGHRFTQTLSPLTSSVRNLTLSVTKKLDFSPTPSQSSPSMDRLQAQIQRQENELIHLTRELQRLQDRNTQLSGLRQQFAMTNASFILANVVGSDTTSRRELLNQGSDHGVQAGQIVLALPDDGLGDSSNIYQRCVVGQITDVSTKTSRLRLLNDLGFRLPVIIEPAATREEDFRANGILQGQPMEINIAMIEVKEFSIQPGDRVLACSSPRKLPIEMIIGHVKFCQPDKDNPVLWNIVVEPLTSLHTLTNVVIIDTQWK